MEGSYKNGYIERRAGGVYGGVIAIDGITIPNLIGQYFKQDGITYLWLKRQKILEYDQDMQKYFERESKPQFEVYLKKQINNNVVIFKGEFIFMHFVYEITGLWDEVLGMEKQRRLNLYVERLPMSKQKIINSINERRREGSKDHRANQE